MSQTWTEKEEQIVKDNIFLSFVELQKLLPNRTLSSIRNRIFHLNLKRGCHALYTSNKFFFEKYTLNSAYWAGFIAADGWIRDKVCHIGITLKDTESYHLEKFAKDIEFTGTVKFRQILTKFKTNKTAKIYKKSTLTICGAKNLIKDLRINYNIVAKKSLVLKPPIQISNNDIKLAFLIGYIDGDGTISLSKNNRLELSIIGTNEIVSWAKDILDNLIAPTKNHNSQVNKEKKNSKIFRFKVTGYRALSILEILNNFDVSKLERKWKKISLAQKPIYKNEYIANSVGSKRKSRRVSSSLNQ